MKDIDLIKLFRLYAEKLSLEEADSPDVDKEVVNCQIKELLKKNGKTIADLPSLLLQAKDKLTA